MSLYIPQTLLRHPGIAARAESTLHAWQALGCDALALSEPPDWQRDSAAALMEQHWRSDRRAATAALAAIQSGRVSHVVARLLLPTPQWLRVARTGRLALEIHNPLWKPESLRDVPRVLLGGQMGSRLVRRAYAGFFVTQQLLEGRPYRRIPRKLAIGNGKELGAAVPAPANRRIRIGMSVGSSAKWHGVDRFASWAATLPQYEFVLIAPDELAAELDRDPGLDAVTVLGTRSAADYDAALATLDAAVGTMAYDRWNLTEGAPMKVRDYVGAAIPTVLPYRDTNLADVADPALLHLPDWRDTATLAAWLGSIGGARLAATTRGEVSMLRIEERRLRLLLDNA